MSTVSSLGYEIVPKREMQAFIKDKRWWQDQNIILTGIATVIWLTAWTLSFFAVPDHYINYALWLATAIAGAMVIKSAIAALRNKMPLDMNVLMIVAVLGAIYLKEYFEAATVTVLFNIGRALEFYAMDKTRQSLRKLMDLSPDTTLVRVNGEEMEIPTGEVRRGEIILIKPGARIPLDARITHGSSSVNQAPITGESFPVDKSLGDLIYAGTMNQEGYLEAEVIEESEHTTLAGIIRLVEEAQSQKADSERFVDTFARYYTPTVITIAVLLATVPPLFLQAEFHEWFYRAISLLVVSCPCALVISTPVSVVSALGNAANNGILIKGGAYLERAGALKAVAFDKTGTLTKGQPEVIAVYPGEEIVEDEVLQLAAAVEAQSEHPIARAILQLAGERNLDWPPVTNFLSITGVGVKANWGERVLEVVKPEYALERHSLSDADNEKISMIRERGHTVVVLLADGKALGYLALADTVRPEAKEAVNLLRQVGVKNLTMLTGDHSVVGKNIAEGLELDAFHAELLPGEKLEHLERLSTDYGAVGMIGDGINDAPALAGADIGFSLGKSGTDISIDTADIVLMGDDLRKLPYSISLGQRTLQIIKQNIAFSLIVKLLAILLVFPGWLTLWIAVLADTGTALVVILNGMRLLRSQS